MSADEALPCLDFRRKDRLDIQRCRNISARRRLSWSGVDDFESVDAEDDAQQPVRGGRREIEIGGPNRTLGGFRRRWWAV